MALIWEHKFNPEKWVAIQLGLYIFLAMNRMVKEKGSKIEPILPLLFYNGKEKWIPKMTIVEVAIFIKINPSKIKTLFVALNSKNKKDTQ